ncbi:hypothetical protein N0V85_005831 [Neurospora sp. IMI 360204]|nr:hypothetical protein N0V85_005831 [Neurospora sp. IMI 360204]
MAPSLATTAAAAAVIVGGGTLLVSILRLILKFMEYRRGGAKALRERDVERGEKEKME